MAVINTNITSLIGQNNLNKSQSALQTSMERLSSGLRINSAKDDAAGQAIANRMSSQVTGLNQASRNANDGISLSQTAEGALDQVNDNLQRIRELTVQAQNGTNSAEDIDSIQKEVNQRLDEINRVTSQTEFNGTKLFSATKATEGTPATGTEGEEGYTPATPASAGGTSFSIQVGAKDNQTITVSIGSSSGWDSYAGEEGDDGFVAADDTTSLDSWDSNTRAIDAKGFDVLSANALDTLDQKISSVDDARSDLGAVQNRFESAIDNISTTSTNLSAARSRIEDADYAVEVSNMTRANILQQAGTSVLSQANQTPQSVLSLLQ